MLCVPDLMAVYEQGIIDLEGVQAVQLAMIAHCELMGDRVAILDAPPGLNAQQVKEWRVDKAGYDSKYATLYWPWVKVFDPLSGQATVRAAVRPHGRHLGAQRRHARRPQGAGQRGRPRRDRARAPDHQGRAGPAQPGRHQLHPRLPRPRHPRLGRAHAVERPGVALPQRAAALQLRRGVDPRGHPVGRLRAERPAICGSRVKRTINAFLLRVWRTARCSGRRPARRSTSSATPRTNPPEVRDAGQLVVEIGIAPVKPAEFVVFRIAQFSGGAALSE